MTRSTIGRNNSIRLMKRLSCKGVPATCDPSLWEYHVWGAGLRPATGTHIFGPETFCTYREGWATRHHNLKPALGGHSSKLM